VHGNIFGQHPKILIFGYEISFREKFEHDTDGAAIVDIRDYSPGTQSPICLFVGRLLTYLMENNLGFFYVSAR
jgi:hypothetical protein